MLSINNNKGKDICVCLLTYNHAHLIESTLLSILDQTIDGYDILISDDCSTDKTLEIVRSISENNPRITVMQTPKNLGMAKNANFAISKINKPYIALLHHDDICRRDLLERWHLVLERNPDASFVFNPYGVYKSNYVYKWDMPGEVIDGNWLLTKYLFKYWGCCVRGTAMIRRDSWNAVGGMKEEFGMLADIDLWMRFAMRWKVGYVDEPVITVRHDRPSNYPEAYKENNWSWKRRNILYQIHIENRISYWNITTLVGCIRWIFFRLKLSIETAKWLIYAVIRKKNYMITTSDESVTKYDLFPLRIFRCILIKIYSN